MTNQTSPVTPQDLDEASLDLVAGAGVMVPEADLRRKQEQEDKLAGGSNA